MFHEMINYATKNYPFLIEHVNVRYIPHFHDETEIVYVTKGQINVTIGNNSFLLKKGQICIITSGLIHNLYSYDDSNSFVMKLFPVIDLKNILLENNVLSPGNDNYDELKKCITTIMDENKKKRDKYELAVNISAEKIFLMIIRNMKYKRLEDKDRTKLSDSSGFLNSVTAFLENHYMDRFSLEDVAEHFYYTRSYFCHYFKRITGVTFWEYYTVFRLEKALQLMADYPEKSFIEISGNSGFKNVRSFNLSFKKYHNCTPSEYMKKYNNKHKQKNI